MIVYYLYGIIRSQIALSSMPFKNVKRLVGESFVASILVLYFWIQKFVRIIETRQQLICLTQLKILLKSQSGMTFGIGQDHPALTQTLLSQI